MTINYIVKGIYNVYYTDHIYQRNMYLLMDKYFWKYALSVVYSNI